MLVICCYIEVIMSDTGECVREINFAVRSLSLENDVTSCVVLVEVSESYMHKRKSVTLLS